MGVAVDVFTGLPPLPYNFTTPLVAANRTLSVFDFVSGASLHVWVAGRALPMNLRVNSSLSVQFGTSFDGFVATECIFVLMLNPTYNPGSWKKNRSKKRFGV